MSMDWLRWHHGTVNDPKWRVIARRAKSSIPVVLSVWAIMLENASQANPRGALQGWNHEDVAAALDVDASEIEAIHDAMQGKTLDGNTLTGWDKRQPKREREDSSAERVRAHRERNKEGVSEHVTPCNADETQETPRLDEIREDTDKTKEEPKEEAPPRDRAAPTTRAELDLSVLPEDLSPSLWKDFVKHRRGKRAPVNTQAVVDSVAEELRKAMADGWTADSAIREAIAAGWTGIKADWLRNRKSGTSGGAGLKTRQQLADERSRAAVDEFVGSGRIIEGEKV